MQRRRKVAFPLENRMMTNAPYELESRAQPGQSIDEIDTPALVVDLDRMERNIERWQTAIEGAGTRLRPHVKTHKIPEIALQQIAAGGSGIACAKVAEAEVFAAQGCDDIVVAYPVVGQAKWRRVSALAQGGVRVAVGCDSEVAARGLSECAGQQDAEVGVHLEIDTGFHRCGIEPGRYDEIVALCRLIGSLPGLRLEGITTHRGIFFEGADRMTKEEAGHEEGRILVELAERLRADDVEIREVTAGGTITGRSVAEVPGVTEVRAGTYVFNDLMQIGFETADWDDLALTALCTVVSHPTRERATIDGGSKTFSGDRGLAGTQVSFGIDAIALASGADVSVERLTEEHGMVRVGGTDVEVGEKLRFFPTHVCTAVNLSDQLIGLRGDRVERVWPVLARGKRT
jgi:D-serine deaminase-like pyridoxal phosphate-dependent protein